MDEEQEIQELVEKFICHYKRAKSNYKKGQSLLKRSFEDYVESGKVVKELKLLIKKRGLKWEDFCKPHLGIASRTANDYETLVEIHNLKWVKEERKNGNHNYTSILKIKAEREGKNKPKPGKERRDIIRNNFINQVLKDLTEFQLEIFSTINNDLDESWTADLREWIEKVEVRYNYLRKANDHLEFDKKMERELIITALSDVQLNNNYTRKLESTKQ